MELGGRGRDDKREEMNFYASAEVVQTCQPLGSLPELTVSFVSPRGNSPCRQATPIMLLRAVLSLRKSVISSFCSNRSRQTFQLLI